MKIGELGVVFFLSISWCRSIGIRIHGELYSKRLQPVRVVGHLQHSHSSSNKNNNKHCNISKVSRCNNDHFRDKKSTLLQHSGIQRTAMSSILSLLTLQGSDMEVKTSDVNSGPLTDGTVGDALIGDSTRDQIDGEEVQQIVANGILHMIEKVDTIMAETDGNFFTKISLRYAVGMPLSGIH
ncbi:hypothetical protein O6H91_02G050800 [Diphasiastrum complanatum]|uniref:Uncharacterized protein n=2 Tax=Diphasiastrum complanatum TaxID=34168 RepID=A0ACC2EFB7_DIPCM|nr:hypothetical protein O6H91_02G050800 [Diphasiastrum complanatum]KAJ7565170.1 hypothetical protein O6H91_02G050800 [Diphasiastrum complanatum]